MRSWGWGCPDEISAFIKNGRDCCLSVKWGHSENMCPIYKLDKELSPDTEFADTLILDSPTSRILRNNTWYLTTCVCILSHFSYVQLLAIPRTIAPQAPLSMGFSRQEYWSGLPCPPPGDLLDPRIERVSPMSLALAGRFFTTSTTW